MVRKKIAPNSAKNTSAIETLAPLKRRTANRRTSSIGAELRSSQATKATSAASATPNPPSTTASVQPRSPPASMIAHVSTPSPAVESIAPTGSSREAFGSRDSGTSAGAAARATATIGRLTRNTEPQLKCSISQPPATGPIAMPRPATAAQIPIAFGRSSAGKTFVRIDRVEGMMSAPPIPMRARLAISMSALVASADSSEAAPNTARPDHERQPATEAVAEAAHGQQQAREYERVGVDDPLQGARRGVELALDRRQSNVEDRVVQRDDQQGHGQDDERPPPAVVCLAGCGCHWDQLLRLYSIRNDCVSIVKHIPVIYATPASHK